MASLSLYTQFEINLMSNRKVIAVKERKFTLMVKTTQKSDLSLSAIFSVIAYS